MRLIDRITGWRALISFEVVLGDKSDVSVRLVRAHPTVEDVEFVRFWAFAQARILYEIWLLNAPQAFHALTYISRIVEQPLGARVDCLRRAGLQFHHHVPQVSKSIEQIAGQYLGRRDAEWKIHFLVPPVFDGNIPHPLAMIAGIVLFQQVLTTIKDTPWIQQALTATARTFVRHFARGEWAGRRSMEELPQAVFVKETRFR